MGLFDKTSNEFIDIIGWTDDSSDTLVWRFPRYENEIKMGAKLTVRPSQVAIFVNEGKVADEFAAGLYELQTQNMPLISTLKGWKYGFNSPFKAEVYFFNLRQFTNNKWGTKNPIMLRDPEFGPIRIRAFGSYVIRITDPKRFLLEIVGTESQFNVEEISEQLRSMVITRFSDAIAESKIAALDMASNYNELSAVLQPKLNEDFKEMGLELSKFLVENISFPPEVEAALDKRSSMGIIGNLDKYTQYQTGIALEKAAENPNGSMGTVMGMGLGMNAGSLGGSKQNQQEQTPPPLASYYVAINGAQQGPYPKSKMAELAQSGGLTAESLVWKQGLADWMTARQLPELEELWNTPPPLPKH